MLYLVSYDTVEASNPSHMCFKQSYICSIFKSRTRRNLCCIILYLLYFILLTNYPYIFPKLLANLTHKISYSYSLIQCKFFSVVFLKNGLGSRPWQAATRYFQFYKCNSFDITLDLLHYWTNEEEKYKNGDLILTLKSKVSAAYLLSVYKDGCNKLERNITLRALFIKKDKIVTNLKFIFPMSTYSEKA